MVTGKESQEMVHERRLDGGASMHDEVRAPGDG